MDGWFWGLVGALGAFLLIAVLAVLVQARGRRRDRAELGDLRAEVRALADRLDPRPTPVRTGADRDAEFVITRVGEPAVDHHDRDHGRDQASRPVGDRVVLSTTLGEPLVKAVALGHGLRRALAPETRNRIGFEVRREVKRTRKARRREMRDAWREMRTRRSPTDPAAVSREPDAGLDVA